MSSIRTIKDLPIEERFAPGHSLCPGCGAAMLAKLVVKIAGKDAIIVNPTGCLEVCTSLYPNSSWKVPWIHNAFENGAITASGVKAAFKALKRKGYTDKDPYVIVLGGDGGTSDIGFQALSGALERGDEITYICYDNEAYMNTGIQRSSATPFGAWTTTSPFGRVSFGKKQLKKDLFSIAIAHRVKYAATATIGYVNDLIRKIDKAIKNTPSFIHYLCPCPTGWRFDESLSVEITKVAVQTGLWPLLEYENGQVKLTVPVRKRLPVTKYLFMQGRFKHLKDHPEVVKRIQEYADELAAKYGMGPVEE